MNLSLSSVTKEMLVLIDRHSKPIPPNASVYFVVSDRDLERPLDWLIDECLRPSVLELMCGKSLPDEDFNEEVIEVYKGVELRGRANHDDWPSTKFRFDMRWLHAAF